MTETITKLKKVYGKYKQTFLAFFALTLLFIVGVSLFELGFFKKEVKISRQVLKIEKEYEFNGRRPTGLEFLDGDILVVLPSEKRVYVMDHSGEMINSFTVNLPGIWDVAWDGNYLWVADLLRNDIWKINITTGVKLKSITGNWVLPYGLSWGDNALWISDPELGKIMKVNSSNGEILREVDYIGVLGLVYHNRELWVSPEAGDYIRVLNATTFTEIRKYYSPGPLPSGLAFDTNEKLYIGDVGYNKIYRVDPFASQYRYESSEAPPWLFFLYGFLLLALILSFLFQYRYENY